MKKLLVAFIIFAVPALAPAQQDPSLVISSTVDKVLTDLETNRETFRADPAKLYAMVEQHVLPVVDVQQVSRLVVGKYWRRSTPEQQQQFIQEFKSFLMKSYAQGLFQYTGQKIEYQPARFNEDGSRAIVDASLRSSERNIPVSFKLSLDNDKQWRIYNVVADGVNLVTNFRTSYTSIIEQQGMDGLINSLAEKNRT